MKQKPKWPGRILHILFFMGMTAWFIYTRMITHTGIPLDSEPINGIFEAAKVNGSGIQTVWYWDAWYLQTLSCLFLFLGNKILVILYFQIVLQAVSFLLLIYIGWTIYRGIWGWTLPALYVFVPYTTLLVLNVTPLNFWICIALLLVSLLCIPIRIWKRKKQNGKIKNPNIKAHSETTEANVSDTSAANFFEWDEIQQEIKKTDPKSEDNSFSDEVSEDTGVIRVSDILKAVSGEESQTEESLKEPIINKTDMIENVLLMPKKHVSRNLEYSFEPSGDMMCYDIELEDDDYDYE